MRPQSTVRLGLRAPQILDELHEAQEELRCGRERVACLPKLVTRTRARDRPQTAQSRATVPRQLPARVRSVHGGGYARQRSAPAAHVCAPATPGRPYGNTTADLRLVEANMRLRCVRARATQRLSALAGGE